MAGLSSPLLSSAIMALALALALVATSPSDVAVAGDPDLLQDICVADFTSGLMVNGFACKAAAAVDEDDFYFRGLGAAGNTSNAYGSVVTGANVEKVPGLNTLGVSMARIDYAGGGGVNPPHTHPRATEMVFVLHGELHVGFVTTGNKLVAKTITAGDVFVFPRGLVHFQRNAGDAPAAVVSAFNSQLPGTQSVAMALFAAAPAVPDSVLTKAFQIGTKEVDKIKSRLAPKKI